MKKIVMTFGTFDGIHPGHESLLKQAKSLGDELVVALAQDTTVQRLKGDLPQYKFRERQMILEDSGLVDLVIPADKKLGSYKSVKRIKPETIALGYDQTELKKDLEQWIKDNKEPIQLITLSAFKPEQFKTSLLK
ncbi:MAG: adenylyltransferase/cytidyltransferase family protein [Patescibacteria group bacterium]